MNHNNKTTAEMMGMAAFKAGKKRIPYQDKNCMDLLAGLKMGEGGDKIMKSWLKGWDNANLSTTI